jgi:Glycosyltransferase family 87
VAPSVDPRRERWLLALATLAILATRLPWIAAGYGSDPDGYRVVAAARAIAQSGQYRASRLPGYPVYEYLTVLSANGPPWLSNAVTALFSAAAFVLFVLILRYFKIGAAVLIAAGFAMTPVIYLNSCSTMDYVPALALMLAATYALLRHRPVLAGLCLGLATGCRITSGVLGLALCLWLWLEHPPRTAVRQCLVLGVTSLLVAGLCFVPVYRHYGGDFFAFYDNAWYPPWDVVYARALPNAWGHLGLWALVALVLAAPLHARALRARWRDAQVRHALAFAGLAVLLYVLGFLRLPDETGYLAPAVPFVLLVIALLAPVRVSAALSLVLLCSGLGPMAEDHAVRESQLQATGAIIAAVAKLPGQAVVVSGWILPRIELALGGDREGAHQFVYLVENLGDYQHYQAQGKSLYFVPGVDLYESQAHELELAQLGAQPLAVARERQRPASTGE